MTKPPIRGRVGFSVIYPGKPTQTWLVVVLVALLAAAAAPSAMAAAAGAAAAAQTTVTDLEDEVMCPVCGTLLELAEAPQAKRQRAFIARLASEGRSKAEIKDALVAEYGRAVLALPKGSGFDLSAYLVPAIGFLVAAIALAVGIARWRRAARGRDRPGPGAGPGGKDAERLDADIAKYDL